ncbi:MAG: TetR/AcrR family transcriptional regulator [Chloroflexota bacterium]
MVSEVRAHIANAELVRERRRHIIESSLKLFLKRGYHSATIRELCRASGMSVGALYSYIRSKEDILRLIMDEMIEEWHTFLEGATSAGRPSEALPAAIEKYLRFMDRYQDMNLVAYREFLSLPQFISQGLTDMELNTVALFRDLVYKGCESGEFEASDGSLVAWNISIAGTMWVLKRWSLQKQCTLEEFVREQTELVMRSLAPRK